MGIISVGRGGRAIAGRWFTVLGAVSAVLILARVLSPLNLPGVDLANFAGYVLCCLWEKYSKWSKNQLPPVFNRRCCAAQWKKMRYSNQKLKDRLRWKPEIPMGKAMSTASRS